MVDYFNQGGAFNVANPDSVGFLDWHFR